MTEKSYPQIVSDREMREWILGCPIMINRVKLIRFAEGEAPKLEVISAVCGNFPEMSYTADVEYQNERREVIGEKNNLKFKSGKSDLIETGEVRAVYAYVLIKSVELPDGTFWINETVQRGKVYPEQEILWQTDPLYEQIKHECDGVTEARYMPDIIDGAWRCTCGQINLETSGECGNCGCSREWLKSHFDREYLNAKKEESDKKNENIVRQKKNHNIHKLSNKIGAGIVIACSVCAVALVVLTFAYFIPQFRYNKAARLAENCEYDEAIEIFQKLGNYSDAESMVGKVVYKKAQHMTGLESVYVSDSSLMPYYSISADGVLSFRKDKYNGSWENFIIPDVFDDVIVRELDRNFCLNCEELVSVTISDCTEVIGEQAFNNCKSLKKVNFGKSVKTIMPRAFINCSSIEEIEIPDTVEYLGIRAFNNCTSLRKAVLGNGITEIGSYQFSFCISLERLTLVSPITSVGEFAFSDCDNFKKLYCRFSETEWGNPKIYDGNDDFSAAEKYFDQ